MGAHGCGAEPGSEWATRVKGFRAILVANPVVGRRINCLLLLLLLLPHALSKDLLARARSSTIIQNFLAHLSNG